MGVISQYRETDLIKPGRDELGDMGQNSASIGRGC